MHKDPVHAVTESALLRLHFPPVQDPAPPGIFFTAAAFDKYSVAERLKQARADKAGSAQAFGHHLSPLREPSDLSEGPPDEEDFLSSSSSEDAPEQGATSDAAGQLVVRAERLSSGQRAGPSGRGPANSGGAHSPRTGSKRKRSVVVQAAAAGKSPVQEEAAAGALAMATKHTGATAYNRGRGVEHVASEEASAWDEDAPQPSQAPQRAGTFGAAGGIGKGAPGTQSKGSKAKATAGAARQHGSSAGKTANGKAARPAILPAPVEMTAGSLSVPSSAQPVPAQKAPGAAPAQKAKSKAAPKPKAAGAAASKPSGVPHHPAAAGVAAAPIQAVLSEHAAANAAIMRNLGATKRYSFQAAPLQPAAAALPVAAAVLPLPNGARPPKPGSKTAKLNGTALPSKKAPKGPKQAQQEAHADSVAAPKQKGSKGPSPAPYPEKLTAAQQGAGADAEALVDPGEDQGDGGLPAEAGAEQAQHPELGESAAGAGGEQMEEGGGDKGATGEVTMKRPRVLLALLNPTDPRYDPAFALEYAAVREAAGRAGGKRVKRRAGKPQVWSRLPARDHAWFLQHQGVALRGQEAEAYGELAARVAEEQQAFLRAQWAGAGAHPECYAAVDARATAQLEAHLGRKRADVRRLPRLWSLHSRVSVAQLADAKPGALRLIHLSSVQAEGVPAPFTMPRTGTTIDLDLPLFAAASPTASSPGEGGAEGDGPLEAVQKPRAPLLEQDDTALRIAADKRASVVMAASALRALAGMQAPALSPGWEIPVTLVEQRDPPRDDQGAEHAGDAAPSSAPRLVACFGKPLVKRLMSARERLELLHKHALRTLGVNPHLARRQAETAPDDIVWAHAAQSQKGAWRASLMEDLLQELQPGSAAVQPATAANPRANQPAKTAQHSAAPASHASAVRAATSAADGAAEPEKAQLRIAGGQANVQGSAEQQEGEDQDLGQMVPNGSRGQQQKVGKGQAIGEGEAEDKGEEGGEGDGDDLSDMLEAELASGGEQEAPDEAALRPATHDVPINLAPVSFATRYELWRLGDLRLVTRAHVRAALTHAPDGGALGTGLEVAAKIEYHGDEEADREEVTTAELARWWTGALLRPGAQALVGHVGARSSNLLAAERLSPRALADSAAAAGYSEPFLWRLAAELARAALHLNRPGRYLLTHAPGSPVVCVFAALLEGEDASIEQQVQPLPCYTGDEAGTAYDLWAAHQDSGRIDDTQVPYIPRRWRPSHPDVPHIPYTFALKAPAPGRGRGCGGGNASSRSESKQPQRKRVRKMPPSAWTIGQRPDWDEIPQKETAGNADFSAQEYAQLLGEELDA